MAWEEVRRIAQLCARKTVIYRATINTATLANTDTSQVLFEAKSPYGGRIRYLNIYATTAGGTQAQGRIIVDDTVLTTLTLTTSSARCNSFCLYGGTSSNCFSATIKATNGDSVTHGSPGTSISGAGLWADVVANSSNILPLSYEREVNWEFLKNFRIEKTNNTTGLTSATLYIAVVYDIGADV